MLFEIKVLYDFFLEDSLLCLYALFGHGANLREMWPSIAVKALQGIISLIAEQRADSNMHQVLLLLFCKGSPDIAELLDANEKEHCLQVR